jgi:hypothetical protein
MTDEIKIPRGAIWAADVFEMFIDGIGSAIAFCMPESQDPLERAKTPQDVRDYANTIRHSQPSFADELMAAADRAEGIEE